MKKLSSGELALFCYQLYVVLKSGLHMTEAMELMKGEFETGELSKVANELSESIALGEKISDALSKHEIFPKYFLQMVRIAEVSGALEREMLELSKYYERKAVVEKKIHRSVSYPVILFIMMMMVTVFLVVSVIPMFSEVIASLGMEVPPATKSVLSVGMFLRKFGLWILLVIAVILAIFIKKKDSPGGNISYGKFLLTNPLTGDLTKKLVTSNFSEAFSMMLKSGLSYYEALPLVDGALDNAYCENEIRKATQGEIVQSISDIVEKQEFFPTLFKRIISLGEKGGMLEESFDKTSDIYREDVEREIDKLTSAVEPVLVIIISILIGIILLTTMIPLVDIISEIG